MKHRLRRQRPNLRAQEVNRWNKVSDYFERNQLQRKPPTIKTYDPSSRVVFCKNISGSDRAQFESMSISGLAWELEDDGSTGLIFELDTADPDAPLAILTTPIADGETGLAVVSGLALALVGPGTGRTLQPSATNHRLEPASAGTNAALVDPDASAQKLLPVEIGSAGTAAGQKIVQTPGGGIAARSGTTVGSATCTEYKIASGTLTTNTDTITVKNIWPFAIPASMYILAAKEQITGEWVAIHPGVIDVQWDSPDLEQTLDGSTYAIIDTAEVCT